MVFTLSTSMVSRKPCKYSNVGFALSNSSCSRISIAFDIWKLRCSLNDLLRCARQNWENYWKNFMEKNCARFPLQELKAIFQGKLLAKTVKCNLSNKINVKTKLWSFKILFKWLIKLTHRKTQILPNLTLLSPNAIRSIILWMKNWKCNQFKVQCVGGMEIHLAKC